MENMLEFYKKELEDDVADDEYPVLKRKRKKKKTSKYFKAVNKRLKKQNKYLKKLIKSCKAHDTEKSKKEKKPKSERTFWCKIGDAFVKAVPVILTTFVTAVCSFFFKGKTGYKTSRFGWAVG